LDEAKVAVKDVEGTAPGLDHGREQAVVCIIRSVVQDKSLSVSKARLINPGKDHRIVSGMC
jgi:hypothetical protein